MINNNQDNYKDGGEALKRRGIKRKNLLEMLESKTEKKIQIEDWGDGVGATEAGVRGEKVWDADGEG